MFLYYVGMNTTFAQKVKPHALSPGGSWHRVARSDEEYVTRSYVRLFTDLMISFTDKRYLFIDKLTG